jgi:predicted HAD superfamily Cof-like phosphohydrolase
MSPAAESAVFVPHSNAAKLREFHRAIGLNLPTQPTVPSAELLSLRRTLIAEEWAEVQQEFEVLHSRLNTAGAPAPAPLDLAPLAHELVDLLYVTYGALDALGLDADAIFAEVHRANLTKAAGPKRADGKQLKPEGWQPADVRAVIAGQR